MMKIRTRTSIAAVAVASVVGGGVAGAVLAGPTTAIAQEAEDGTTVISDGFTTIEEVLAQLVDEGVITQDQANTVGERLQEARPRHGFGGRMGHGFGGGLEDVAALLGVSVDDLGSALMDGSSLADVAADNNVDVQAVIDLLVANAQERLDAAVADGHLTADEAAERAAEIETRVTDMVNGEIEMGRRGFGHRGFGDRFGSDNQVEDVLFEA